MLVLLVGRATNPDFVISKRHFKLAVIAEMIHTASLIHGDVLEENADPSEEEKGTVVHQEAASDLNTAGLISECCHSASILSGHRVDDLTAQACRDFGKDLATAQQLVAEAEQAELLIKASRTRQVKWPE